MSQFASAHSGIMELHSRYTDAVWRKDATAFAECFTENGEWRISGRVMRGRAEIHDTISAILDNFIHVLMTFRPPILTAGQGCASGRTYVDERCAWKNGDRNISVGRYYEHFVEQDGRWLFEWRLFQLLYRGPADMTGEFFDHPDYGAPPGMPPRDAIPMDTSSATARWGLDQG